MRGRSTALGDDPEDDALHASRIAVKRARYAADLAAHELGRPGERFVALAKQLQDILGDHQDAVVAEARIRAWVATAPAGGVRGGTARPARARPHGRRPRGVAGRVAAARPGRAAGRPLSSVVRAAGGIVVREQRRTDARVLLVHRPAYDDWTFPKGKVEPGESDEECAVREVEEETGLRCSLGRELPSTEYTDGKGRPKTVRYWEMDVVGGELRFDHEVDRAVGHTRRGVPTSSPTTATGPSPEPCSTEPRVRTPGAIRRAGSLPGR